MQVNIWCFSQLGENCCVNRRKQQERVPTGADNSRESKSFYAFLINK
jgi:hypothetical protein